MIIAKQIGNAVVENNYYELFTQETVKDIDGNDVVIPRSLGQYNVAQLEHEKQNYLNAIASIEEKIEAIEELLS